MHLIKLLNFVMLYIISIYFICIFLQVVTAIQGLIDAADEQMRRRENATNLSKVRRVFIFLPSYSSYPPPLSF